MLTRSDRTPADLDVTTTYVVRDRRHLGRYILTLLILIIVAWVALKLARNPNMEWNTVGEYLFSRPILDGIGTTLELTAVCFLLSVLVGLLLAFASESQNWVSRYVTVGYLWIFRSLPLLVQLIFWFNLGLLFPNMVLRLPLLGTLVHVKTNAVITGLGASVIGLTLHEAAFTCEVFRGGLLAIAPGQKRAAKAIGLTEQQTRRYIVVPQMTRVVLPPMGNQLINLLKSTSLVSVIGGGDLLTRAEYIYSSNFRVIGLLIVAGIWYLVIISITTLGQRRLERLLRVSAKTSK